MKERPILMSGPMVRATLEDLKTQTRRASGLEHVNEAPDAWTPVRAGPLGGRFAVTFQHNDAYWTCFCPCGRVGDRLWVRETWATVKTLDHLAPAACFQYDRPPIVYLASWTGAARNSENRGRWRPSIHMPRWASQLDLEITDVRVERLKDISEADCCAEMGCPAEWPGPGSEPYPRDLRGAFAALWNEINARRGYTWERNPWVWAISYKRGGR